MTLDDRAGFATGRADRLCRSAGRGMSNNARNAPYLAVAVKELGKENEKGERRKKNPFRFSRRDRRRGDGRGWKGRDNIASVEVEEEEEVEGRPWRGAGGPRMWHHLLLFLVLGATPGLGATPAPGALHERVKYLEVSENVRPGTRVGFIDIDSPPYLIAPVPGSPVETDLMIESATGEIRTRVPLDRETRPSYSLVALPRVRVVITVLDENDNAPTFAVEHVYIEFPENSPRDQRGRDGVLYLDLQIAGTLDREMRSRYHLVIEALDGGTPPLRSHLHVNVTVQDVNDNPPVFNQTRYDASVPENATVGTPVLAVNATDADAGDNGRIEYSINRRQSDREEMFRIDPETGMVYVNKALDFESKERHELVIVARDRGAQPLEASTFLSIRVTDVNDNQPDITVIFLSDDATPKISESAQLGEFVARISVSDPDSRTEYSNATVTLTGGEGHFGLTTRDNIIYLVVVERPLDREEQSVYELSVEATDAGTPPLCAERTFRLLVTDVNDNAPIFDRERYEAHLLEASEPGTSVIQVIASDLDEGVNSAVRYSLANATWFAIDETTGLITTVTHVDCEANPAPILLVYATDSGRPPLSSSATVRVTVHDLNDNEPIFEKPLYNASVPEDLPVGRCFLKNANKLSPRPSEGVLHEPARRGGAASLRPAVRAAVRICIHPTMTRPGWNKG
ncbi:PREDICTED: protein dachsous-like [Cyphomyrmex costatus]|uniref:protein dachsous-like n=1 Tax=Cyphomyrmex costatus TaxID=456900 RepID=UPI0008523F67|nr:PREDICTED: protein dachsous-like [Cyphomyrmex costatus]